MLRMCLLALGLCALTARPLLAEPLRLGTYHIPDMVEDDQHGLFIELTREIVRRTHLDIEIVLMPTVRTLVAFEHNEIDGYFPALDTTLPKPAIASTRFYTKRDFAFVRQGEDIPGSIAELAGMSVGLTAGYPYAQAITNNPGITLEYAQSDELNVRKLLARRFDVFIVEEYSGRQALLSVGAGDAVRYNPNAPLSEQAVYYALQENEKGRIAAKKISAAIDAMRHDGSLARIMARAARGHSGKK